VTSRTCASGRHIKHHLRLDCGAFTTHYAAKSYVHRLLVFILSVPPSLPLEITFVIAGSQSTASPLWPVHFSVDVLSCPEHALSCAMRDTASQQALAKETIAETALVPPN
jgi:hypothetical protein